MPPKAILLAGLLAVVTAAEKHLLPPPTGKYNVGALKRTIKLYNPYDATYPGGIQSEYLATMYYPTYDKATRPQPVVDQELADILEPYWTVTPGTMRSAVASINWDADFLPSGSKDCGLPTLIFGPGGLGPPTNVYTTLIVDLVSHGYVIAALDHPYEQPFIRFENGTGLVGLPTDYSPPDLPQFYEAVQNARINDTLHFISIYPKLVQSLGADWNTSVYGAFGHSLGGSTAIGAAYKNSEIASVLNMDGSIFGRGNSSTRADLGKPAFNFGSGQHVQGIDTSWDTFASQQTEDFEWLTVNGSTHVDFSDATVWKIYDKGFTRLGPIKGLQMVKIMRRYVRAWFDYTLLGKERPILEEDPGGLDQVNYIETVGDAS